MVLENDVSTVYLQHGISVGIVSQSEVKEKTI